MSLCPKLDSAIVHVRQAIGHLEAIRRIANTVACRKHNGRARSHLDIAAQALVELRLLHYPTVAAPRGQGPAAPVGDQDSRSGPKPS